MPLNGAAHDLKLGERVFDNTSRNTTKQNNIYIYIYIYIYPGPKLCKFLISKSNQYTFSKSDAFDSRNITFWVPGLISNPPISKFETRKIEIPQNEYPQNIYTFVSLMEYREADRMYRVQYMITNIKMMRGCIIVGYLGVGVDVPVTSPCCWSFVSTVQDFTHASTYIIRSRHLFTM